MFKVFFNTCDLEDLQLARHEKGPPLASRWSRGSSEPVLDLSPGLSPDGGASETLDGLLSGPPDPLAGLLDELPPVEVPGLDLLSDGGGKDRVGGDLDIDLSGLGGEDGVVTDDGGGGSVNNDGVDGEDGVLSVDGGADGVASNAGDASRNVVGGGGAGGQDSGSGLGGEGVVGHLNLLGDLVGEDGDSEDGGQAGNSQDGTDNDGGLHALDRALDVGQLSLEAGHGGSSLGLHDDDLV